MGKAVYELIGYRLVEAEYRRNSSSNATRFRIDLTNKKFGNNKSFFTFCINVQIYFGEEKSTFLFDCAFVINDLKWLESINNENIYLSSFFSSVFPFIREKILTLTTDYRMGFMIPILDIRNMDFSHGIEFSRKTR